MAATTMTVEDVRNRMRCREALERLQHGMVRLRGGELELVATALEADAGALDGILGMTPASEQVRRLTLLETKGAK